MPVFNDDNIKCRECGEVPLILKGVNRDLCPACHVMQFIVTFCTHTKGKWAHQPFELLDWQRDAIRKAFGTIRPDGNRQYRFVYVEIPKKNGKSELGAALALYGLLGDEEAGAEVYSAAADRDQAALVYDVAADMVRNNSTLRRRLKIIDSKKRLVYHATGSFYRALSSDVKTKHGINPSCIIFDELHAQPNRELWVVLTEGTDAAREQQQIWVLTTAGINDPTAIGFEIHEMARQIDEGIIEDPTFLPIIYGADKTVDDWEDEEVWKRVNPSMGHIFDLEKIRRDFKSVKNQPSRINDFMRFRLNMWVSQITRFIMMDHWDACAWVVPPGLLEGRGCYGGLDLSTTTDLTAFVLAFEHMEKAEIPGLADKEGVPDLIVPVIPYFWIPADNIAEKSRIDNVRYDLWVEQGLITATDGTSVDYKSVKQAVLDAKERYQLREVGYDSWNATGIATELQDDEGLVMVNVTQGYRTLTEPTKELDRLLRAREMTHGGHPVLRWCADNLMVRTDPAGNVKPDKEKSTGRIDGIAATVNALSRHLVNRVEDDDWDDELLVL